MPHKVEIVCHKGANKHAPENTWAAARLCVEWGMDYVEVDVNVSKDGVLYILHGPTLDKTTNGTGYIGDLTSEEIDRLDAGSWFSPRFAGERVPRLEPFLRWIKGKAKVFLDVKWVHPQPIIDLIYALGMERDCFLWCEIDEWMLEFRRLDRQLALKYNVKSVDDVVAAADRFQANIVEVTPEHISHELVAASHARGLRVMLNTIDHEPAAFPYVLEYGVDMVNTDNGDLLRRFLEGAQRPAPSALANP